MAAFTDKEEFSTVVQVINGLNLPAISEIVGRTGRAITSITSVMQYSGIPNLVICFPMIRGGVTGLRPHIDHCDLVTGSLQNMSGFRHISLFIGSTAVIEKDVVGAARGGGSYSLARRGGMKRA